MIRFENVTKALLGSPILKGINLEIGTGETFVIVGPSGSGKSVTLRHIIGLHRPDSGTVTVDDVNVGTLGRHGLEKLRKRFGVLFQSGALLNWMSVEENVALPLKERPDLKTRSTREMVGYTLELVGMESARHKMPSDISGGMRKRAALARAIITEPDIILYDEPTSGLDPVMSRKIDHLIQSLKKTLRITSVVVTHDLISAFEIGDRIAMLSNGEIIECGTPGEFRASRNRTVREFISAQIHEV